MIHGDINPGNLVAGTNCRGGAAAPYLLDFNASVGLGTPFNAGTRGFMPPEVERCRSKIPAHPSIDVYCLGRTFLWYLHQVRMFLCILCLIMSPSLLRH